MLSFGLHQLSLSRFCEQHLLKVPTGSNSVQTCTASILSLCVCTCCFSWPCYKFVLILNAGTHKSQVRPSLILRTLSQNERGVPHSSSNIYPKNHQTIITTLLTTNWSSVINPLASRATSTPSYCMTTDHIRNGHHFRFEHFHFHCITIVDQDISTFHKFAIAFPTFRQSFNFISVRMLPKVATTTKLLLNFFHSCF